MKQKEFPLVKYSNVHCIIGGVSFIGCYEVLTGVNHEFDPREVYTFIQKYIPNGKIVFNSSLVPSLDTCGLGFFVHCPIHSDDAVVSLGRLVSRLENRSVKFDIEYSETVALLKFAFEYRYIKSYVPYRSFNFHY